MQAFLLRSAPTMTELYEFSSREYKETKNDLKGRFLFLGAQDETRTHNPVKEADFKSAAYTNSATWANYL